MKRSFKVFLVMLLIFILVDSSYLNAQPPPPFPCKPGIVCAGGCQENGVDCWDIDDPVPLDSGLIILAAAGILFGLYKLNSRRSLQV